MESGKAFVGYSWGVTKAIAGIASDLGASAVDTVTPGFRANLLAPFSTEDETRRRRGIMTPEEVRASNEAFLHPFETASKSFESAKKEGNRLLDSGDSFALGNAVGEVAPHVVLAAEGGFSLAKGGANLARKGAAFAKDPLGIGKAVEKGLEVSGAELTAAREAVVVEGGTAAANDSMGSFMATGSEVAHEPGVTRLGSDAVSVRVGKNLAREGEFHDVVVHGMKYDESGAAFYVDGLPTHPNQVAEAIRANPSYQKGQPIRLATCWGGCGPAQELSDLMGVKVRGATNRVEVPRLPESPASVADEGGWLEFFPKRDP